MATPTSTPGFGPNGCVTAVPGPNGEVPFDACNSNYNFHPSHAPAVASAVIFGILTGIHLVEALIYRKLFTWTVLMAASWETAAFAIHSFGARDQQSSGLASSYQTLFLLAPVWLNAFVYMVFARMVYFFRPGGRPIVARMHATWISTLFVWADIVCFLVQATGGVMTGPESDDNTQRIGVKIYIIGIGMQQGFIVMFTMLIIRFHYRQIQADRTGPVTMFLDSETGMPRRRKWKMLLFSLYAMLIAISVRIIFRMIEFMGGDEPEENPLPFNEIYGYVLDATPMMVGLTIAAVVHPGRVLQGPNSEFPHKSRSQKRAEKKARKQAKEEKKRGKEFERSQNMGMGMSYELPHGYIKTAVGDGSRNR